MLGLLRSHWSKVFTAQDIDLHTLDTWLTDDLLHLPAGQVSHLPHARVPKRCFRQAIRLSGSSSPGLDGIPFKAWRKLIDPATDFLHDAFLAMVGTNGLDLVRAEWDTFNESIMVFLPKKPTSSMPDGTAIYPAGNFRPLNITNTDNRLLCSAVRLHIEPIVEPGISQVQRGFIRGRSMLANVIDIEEAMIDAACVDDMPFAIFLDFEAAFPSINQHFMQRVLESRGWPAWFRNFVKVLYDNNFCTISVNGVHTPGFHLTAGVRQGCPLSPIIFSIISDVLLRRVGRLCPEVLVRAYADDIGLVVPRGPGSCGGLSTIFAEYGLVSRLRLHFGKSVLVPLSLHPHEDIRQAVAAVAPLWGALTIAGHAKYLGFLMGPTRGDHIWDGIFTKMSERAQLWKNIGGGLLTSLEAYRMYILPLAGFAAQLLDLPPRWQRVQQHLMVTLCPGARGWATPHFLHQLKSLGFAGELAAAEPMAVGAKCRVYRWENQAHGGLHLARRLRRLRRLRTASDHRLRIATWAPWLDTHMLENVMRAQHSLEAMAEERQTTVDLLIQGNSEVPVPRNRWQKRCGMMLFPPDRAALHRHLRRRLDRWHLTILPGSRVARMERTLQRIKHRVQPRVFAATLKAMLGGWTGNTASPCPFGCGRGQDSVEHFAYCPILSGLYRRHLGLHPVDPSRRLGAFLLLDCSAEDLTKGAVGLFATFKATNASRHGSATAAGAWPQACADGLRPT